MNQQQLETQIQQIQQKQVKQIENRLYEQKSNELYHLTYAEASYIERQISQLPLPQGQAYILQVQRTPQQTLYKPAVRQPHYSSFAVQEYASLQSYYRSMQIMQKRMGANEYYCLLTLQLLLQNPLSIYFTYAPNTIFLKMPNYYDRILKPLDITIIRHKLFRGDYTNIADEFQLDVVTMIHNARVYFINDDEMFEVSILFEQLFWKVYKEEIHKYKEALAEYKRIKKEMRTKVTRPQLKQYSLEDRKRIKAKISKQPLQVQAQINRFLGEKCREHIQKGEISIQKIPRRILAKVQKMLASLARDDGVYDESEDNPLPLLEMDEAIGNITIEDALGSDSDS